MKPLNMLIRCKPKQQDSGMYILPHYKYHKNAEKASHLHYLGVVKKTKNLSGGSQLCS